MHRVLSLSFLLLVSIGCLAQIPRAYYPNGKKISIQWDSLNDLFQKLGMDNPSPKMQILDQGEVFFKHFTDIPVLVVFRGNQSPDKISQLIALGKKEQKEYLYSYSYYYDLKKMVNDGSLTKAFLKDTFGEPSAVDTSDVPNEKIIFADHNCVIEFYNETPVSVDVKPYKAMKKHKTLIMDYSVVGDEYHIGFNISISNFDKRTIKYIYIAITAYNPVNDVVAKKTVRAIGPIEENDLGSYDFDDAIYSKVAERLTVDNIKIVYMDGTQRIIPKSEIGSIRYHDWEEVGRRTE